MALNEAYYQTDVWSSPQWLRATAQGRGKQARLARERLQELAHEQAQSRQLEQSGRQFAAGQAQQEQLRRDALAARTQAHEENLGQRQLQQQQLEAYRQAQLSNTEEGQRQRRALGILQLAQSPELMRVYGDKAPEIQKALLNQYYNTINVGPTTGQPATAAPATPTAAGLGGLAGNTVDPKAAAVATFQAGQGAAVTSTEQEAGAPTASGGTQPTSFAPSSLAAPYVEGGFVYNQPAGTAGMDFNTNTGEWIPSGQQGTINGQPTGPLLAEMALRHGRTPESASGQAAFRGAQQEAQNRQAGEATTPPMNIPIPEPPTIGGNKPHNAMDFIDITTPQAPTAAPASTNVGDIGAGQPGVPPVGPQRELVPADYIAGFVNKAFAGQTEEMKRQQRLQRY